ncbi:helix-turn-helix domain-containing protein [Flavobacterium sp.]|uniref:helix-turn-helix domain-containing protein n=1 Tax=Flavobacterium sp. TaxID=239 RepID=UPI0037509028
MATAIITTDDLQTFKIELLEDIKRLLKESSGQPGKKWLKSYEVQKVLGISAGTLQTLRNNETIEYTKIGGVIYYDYNEIQKMLNPKLRHK